MIILFGSYACNQWVEDTYTEAHITYEYISDFDILVLTRLKKTAENHANQSRVDSLIIRHKAIKTPVSLIYHSVGQVNYRLKEGRYFFSDIKRRGRLLHDAGKFQLERIRKPSPAKRKQIAEEDFKMWFNSAKDFYLGYQFKPYSSSSPCACHLIIYPSLLIATIIFPKVSQKLTNSVIYFLRCAHALR